MQISRTIRTPDSGPITGTMEESYGEERCTRKGSRRVSRKALAIAKSKDWTLDETRYVERKVPCCEAIGRQLQGSPSRGLKVAGYPNASHSRHLFVIAFN